MPEFQSSKTHSSLGAIEYPRCPRCQGLMALESIVPAPPGYDVRTFECGKCDRVSTRLVSTDPMKTGAAPRWASGGLKPPD